VKFEFFVVGIYDKKISEPPRPLFWATICDLGKRLILLCNKFFKDKKKFLEKGKTKGETR